MDNKNNKKINNNEKNKNKIVSETAASVEIKRKRGRPKKSELNNKKIILNNKKIENNPATVNVNDSNGFQAGNTDIIVPENNQVKRRGRPKGCKNSVKTSRPDSSVQNMVSDEKRKQINQFNFALYKLPKIDKNDPIAVQDRTDLFFSLCEQYNVAPTVSGYAFSLGIDRVTLWTWIDNRNGIVKNRESINILKTAYTYINTSYETLLTEGKIIPVSAFFLMQNNHGYKQQTDHVITAKQDNQDNEEDIINRANLLEG